jgi:hypothetical protein
LSIVCAALSATCGGMGMKQVTDRGGSLGNDTGGNYTGGNLIWIINSASESGYRE